MENYRFDWVFLNMASLINLLTKMGLRFHHHFEETSELTKMPRPARYLIWCGLTPSHFWESLLTVGWKEWSQTMMKNITKRKT